MKSPAFQFYPADWRKDPGVQALGYFERGVWLEILCLMHESSERGVLLLNGLPMPVMALANILGLDKQNLEDALSTIKAYGVAKVRESDGALYSKRMVSDERLTQVRREAGNKGGNPALLKQKQTTRLIQKTTPSSSSSSSTSKDQELPTTSGDGAADPIFGSGLRFLIRKGIAEKGARSYLGAMRKEVRDDLIVAELLIEAERQDVSDPLAWLRKAGRSRGSPSQTKPSVADSFASKTYSGTPENELPSFLRSDSASA